MSKEIGSPHNDLFKNIFGREDMVRDFVRYYMPAEISSDLDLDTLEVSSESYVSDELRESLSDIVVSVQLKNRDVAEIYILIEHKSGQDKWTKLQLLKYLNEKWQKIGKENKINLPVIIPVVFYHGKKRWRRSLEFSDMFDLPGEHYRKYVPKFEHILHEVPVINKQQIKSTIALEVFHLILEYVFYPGKRDKIFESFELLFQGLSMEKAGELFYVFVKYLLSATDVSPEEVKERVKHLPRGEQTVRTTAEILRKEGYEKGVVFGEQQGKLEATRDMVLDVASEQYGLLPSTLEAKIKSIQSVTTLKNLARQAVKLNKIEAFAELVNKAAEN